jgi:hypothetical protein
MPSRPLSWCVSVQSTLCPSEQPRLAIRTIIVACVRLFVHPSIIMMASLFTFKLSQVGPSYLGSGRVKMLAVQMRKGRGPLLPKW